MVPRSLVLVLVTAVVTGAQVSPAATQSPPTSTGLIVGQVVDAVNGAPIAEAIVSLGGLPGPPAGSPLTRIAASPRVMTDGNGRFFFRDLPKSNYTITTTRPGYVNGAYGKLRSVGPSSTLDLGDGERVVDLKIPMWKAGAIGGTVVDEKGEPLVTVTVTVLRRGLRSGRLSWSEAGYAFTDDRGAWRLGNLAPGDYIAAVPSTTVALPTAVVAEAGPGTGTSQLRAELVTASRTWGPSGSREGQAIGNQTIRMASLLPPPVVQSDGSLAVYPTTFYPHASLPDEATVISLASGGVESSANVQLRPVTAVHVSGVLTSPNGPLGRTAIVLERPGLDAIAGLQGRYEIATTLSDADGRFRFLGVPPGQYTVRVLSAPVVGPAQATMMTVQTPDGSSLARGIMLGDSTTPNAPTWWATEKISVGAKDIDGFAINVRAGFRVRGHVVFEGQTAHPPLQRLAPELESRDLRASLAVPTMPIDASGNFVSFETPPGSYLFTMAMPSGWFVKSAIANGRDLSDLPFDLNSDVNDLVVTLADRPATASGVVTGVDGRPDATASVVAFPVDSRYWVDFGAQARRIRDVRTDRHGRFSITGVPSGDYLIVAIPSASLDWTMPKFFETLSRLATRTTLVEGEEKTVTLRTTEVRK